MSDLVRDSFARAVSESIIATGICEHCHKRKELVGGGAVCAECKDQLGESLVKKEDIDSSAVSITDQPRWKNKEDEEDEKKTKELVSEMLRGNITFSQAVSSLAEDPDEEGGDTYVRCICGAQARVPAKSSGVEYSICGNGHRLQIGYSNDGKPVRVSKQYP